MKKSDHQNWRDVTRVHAIKHDICTDASKLPLELAISATGEYIAIYESPTIGDWQNGTIVPTSTFGVRIFRFSLNTTSDDSTIVLVEDDGIQLDPVVPAPQELENFKIIPSKLKKAVGYATFVGPPKDDRSASARFVFCNGLDLQVYKVRHDCLNYSHSITLGDKTSPMCRIHAFEFMMASITTNMFIWAEDNGRHCSTWDLGNGTAMGRFEISGLQYGRRVSTPTMKVVSNHNTIGIVGTDNSITTVDASSGVPLSRRIFKKRLIEDIAFLSDGSDMLLVLLRGEDENRQTALIVDPLRLDVQFQAPCIPPLSRSNAYGCLSAPKDPNAAQELGAVFQPDGEAISCYTVKALVPSFGPNLHTDSPDSCQYELVFTSPASSQDADEMQVSYERQVDVYRKDRHGTQPPPEPVFSFIPEPWELHAAAKGQILPTGDRFVVYARWTIQVWSLPTETDPRCRLLFFWSAFDQSQSKRTFNGKTEMELVLDYHVPFDAVTVQEFKGQHTRKTRFQATVVASSVKQVAIPNMPMYLDDYRRIVKHGIKSVRLLALAHTIVTSGYQDRPPAEKRRTYEYHASAILEFVNKRINHVLPSEKPEGEPFTVLTRLLSDSCPKDSGAKFIAALLNYEKCSWVPRAGPAKTPVEVAIKNKCTIALQTLLDYCVDKASECHPTYLLPVESTFGELSETYSNILEDFFRKVSYLPAQRPDLNNCDVTIANEEWEVVKWKPWSLLPRFKSPELEEYRNPILTFQLRERHASRSEKTFRNAELPDAVKERFDYKAFVVPFPSLLTLGKDSQFHQISGRNFFESPAMLAVLRYKRFGKISESQSILTLFPDIPMKVVTIAGIVLGHILFIFEAVQFFHDGPVRYLGTLFNYIDLISIVSCTTCFFKILLENWKDQVSDGMPKQFEFVPYAIVAMYLHLIVELRVFRPMGIIVNIIVRIILRIRAFFAVFILMVIAFSHGLIYLFYVFPTECNSAGVCTRPKATKYPSSFFAAFTTTLYFLAGRYDPVNEDFEKNKLQFFGIMLIFYCMCFIVMLTVLIAQVSDAFNDAFRDGERAWRRQLSETLAEAEMVIGLLPGGTKLIPTTWKRGRRSLPNMILYMAPAQTASEYPKKKD
ncbi:hypothetical protein BGZ73_004575 [Actinomortierella ambigua]|nr:hypothetical protein BGZ73_004575 [Actinomortierella ambigua]